MGIRSRLSVDWSVCMKYAHKVYFVTSMAIWQAGNSTFKYDTPSLRCSDNLVKLKCKLILLMLL